MFSGKDAANPAYPTQWALNPNAYQNVDSSQVDWAALAQQWIAMKESAAVVTAPPPPTSKPDIEEGEAPMEVENPDGNSDGPVPPGAEWNASTNSWSNNWNQWGWGWPGTGPVDSKIVGDTSMTMNPLIDGYNVSTDGTSPMQGYSTGAVQAPTFQHGYWTAPQVESAGSRDSSRSRDRRSKSKNREHKPSRSSRTPRDKAPAILPVIEPIVMPTALPTTTIDAAKRRQLPAWIREGLEKMEREKQKAIEREQEKQAQEEAEKLKKKYEEEELERMKAEAGGQPLPPPKSKFESDSESESSEKEVKPSSTAAAEQEETDDTKDASVEREHPTLVKRSREEIMQDVMLAVRRSLTEILLEVTDHEIHMVSQEEMARYTAAQASRLNAMKASKSKALAAIASGLGLGAYESSSDDSADEDDRNDLTDQQLQDIIRRKRQDFERTSREIEAEVRRAELREVDDPSTPGGATPDRPRQSRSSTTPPPIERDTPEKNVERRSSKDKRNSHKSSDRVDGFKKLETILEEKPKKSNKKDYTPSPQKSAAKTNHKTSSVSSSDSVDDSSSVSNDYTSESEPEIKSGSKHSKKRKRRSSSSDSVNKTKKGKQKKDKSHKSDDRNSYSKSKYHDDYEKSEKSKKKKDDYYDRHKSSKNRDYERSHKDKYRDESDDERPRKRAKRSRSGSYRSEERVRRREKRSYDRDSSKRDRSYERSSRDYKYDRYERSRDHERRRSRSGSYSRHRR